MTQFSIDKALEVLTQTPETLNSFLKDLSDDWTLSNEGENTWSAFDILGHLIHGEKTDWIPRLKKILFDEKKEFEPFDRFAQFKNSTGKSLCDLLLEFKSLRKENLAYLVSLKLDEQDFDKVGVHPEFGPVTVRQLLATWVTHDMGHIAQIARVIAKQYKEEVGPWTAYISILNK